MPDSSGDPETSAIINAPTLTAEPTPRAAEHLATDEPPRSIGCASPGGNLTDEN